MRKAPVRDDSQGAGRGREGAAAPAHAARVLQLLGEQVSVNPPCTEGSHHSFGAFDCGGVQRLKKEVKACTAGFVTESLPALLAQS